MADKTKILMIGNKDSGKTTYMAGSYGVTKNGIYGFRISADQENDRWLSKIYSGICAGGYPLPSDKRGEYSFDLLYQGKKVHAFNWVDYYGGVISEAKSEKLQTDMDDAEAVMVFIDGEALLNQEKKITQFRRIMALISDKLVMETDYFNVIVVVTKYDKVGRSASLEKVCRPLENFAEAIKNKENIYFRIVPVSCTCQGFYNVDLPLLDILHTSLLIRYMKAREQCIRHVEKVSEYTKKSGIIDWIGSRLTGMPTYGDLAVSSRKAALEELQKMEALETPITKLGEYIGEYQILIPSGHPNWGGEKRKSGKNRFCL